MPKKSKDFSRPPAGRRLRIPLQLYDPASRTFKHQAGSAALITVTDMSEQKRLWKAIETTIEGGAWRNHERAAGGADRVVPAPAGL